MDKQETIRRILMAVEVSDTQIDLVGRVLDLENDTQRVHSVLLDYLTIKCLGLSAQVLLLNNFNSKIEFRDYLQGKGLPVTNISIPRNQDSYYLLEKGVQVEFFKPDFYPKKRK